MPQSRDLSEIRRAYFDSAKNCASYRNAGFGAETPQNNLIFYPIAKTDFILESDRSSERAFYITVVAGQQARTLNIKVEIFRLCLIDK